MIFQRTVGVRKIVLFVFFAFLLNNKCLAEENLAAADTIPVALESESMSEKVSLDKDKIKESEQNLHIVPVLDLKGGVQAEEPQTAAEKKTEALDNWLNGNYMTGDWNGYRTKLEEHGITVGTRLLNSPYGKTRGGLSNVRRVSGYNLLNVDATLDTEKMGLWKGGTAYILYQHKTGMGLTQNYMGDYQIFDSYDYHEMSQITEAWYKQQWKEGKYSLKVGQQDVNVDFGCAKRGLDFANLSFSVIPTVLMPTYPFTAFGSTGTVALNDKVTLKSGIFLKNRSPFSISEVETKTNIKGLPGRFMTGYWYYSKDTTALTGGLDDNGNPGLKTYGSNYGVYQCFDQMIYKEKKDDQKDDQGLSLFGQVGFSPENRNDVDRYFGTGLSYKGLISKRDKDITGIGMAMVGFSRRLNNIDGRMGEETALECFHRIQVTPWLYLQPDVQFIFRPSGIQKSSTAIGMRTLITF